MLDESPRTGIDLEQIDFEDDAARRYWTAQLHCSKTVLRHAVTAVGNKPSDVRRYLRRHPHLSPVWATESDHP